MKENADYYELEELPINKNKINLFIWKNKNEIVGRAFLIPIKLKSKYIKILENECITKKNKDFSIYYEDEKLEEAYKILKENGEKIQVYKVEKIIKELKNKEIKEWEEQK